MGLLSFASQVRKGLPTSVGTPVAGLLHAWYGNYPLTTGYDSLLKVLDTR